jgi:putative flippase GtrA
MPASAVRVPTCPPLLAEACKFALVGVSNTLLSLCVYSVLVAAGEWYPLAAGLAFLAGALNGYAWNRRWTFRRGSRRAPLKYLAVQLAGLGATELLLWALVSPAGLEQVAGYVLTVAAVTTGTFLANRTWTFAT